MAVVESVPSDCDGVYFSKNSDAYCKGQWKGCDGVSCSNLRVAQNGMFLKKVGFEIDFPGTFAPQSYLYKNEFCIAFARVFLDINVT